MNHTRAWWPSLTHTAETDLIQGPIDEPN